MQERKDNWRCDAKPAQRAFAEVARAIARFEPVTMLTSSDQWMEARQALPEEVRVVEMSFDDAWARDTGPSFVVHDDTKEVRGVHWRFNAWGGTEEGCYASWDRDLLVGRKILELESMKRYPQDMVLENGSVHTDGQGTLLTTEECLLNPNRNPTWSKEQIERRLCQCLGASKVIWLPCGLHGDVDTNGHVDNMACFVRPGTVLLAWTDDTHHPQHGRSKAALQVLENSTDAQGRPFEVVKLPIPKPMHLTEEEAGGLVVEDAMPRTAGDLLACSYVNFYNANGGLVVPSFGDMECDAAAASILGRVFRKEVVPVPAREILLGGGGIHCITLSQPAG